MKDKRLQWAQKLNDLLNSSAITEPTRSALQARLKGPKGSPHFFEKSQFQLLSIVCDRLLDQESNQRWVDISHFIDERLADGTGDGWRYSEMPPDGDMLQQGLEGIDQSASILFGNPFIALQKEEQLEILSQIQKGKAPGAVWENLPAARFFEELLAEATEIFYSHPLVQVSMGYTGMADAAGWKKIGLNESDDLETVKELTTKNL